MKNSTDLCRFLQMVLPGLALAAAGLDVKADAPQFHDPKTVAEYKIPIRAYAFNLKEVRLLEGPFQHAMELDRRYLLSLDPARLLHSIRINAGLASQAKPYGGWEEPKGELRGHFMGHYLTACALMYASTGDSQLLEKASEAVAGLAECQKAMGNGFLSAYPESFMDRVENQQPVWAPWYTLHKIYAGLMDMYALAGNAQALEIAKKFADWAKQRTDKLSDERMERMLGNEHGGMNEAMANLYALTGQESYLKLSQRFNHHAVLDPATRKQDKLTGLHANTQIPKFIGHAAQYEFTGDSAYLTAAKFFWEVVTKERSYVIGGHSDGEHFSPKEKLSQYLGPNTTETCNTYNMLKLTQHLFSWEPQAEYADYYERALYNHILASQNPNDGMTCYYVPLKSGSSKTYCTPDNSFWCCTGTGVENHAKYGDSIYFHDGANSLYVNLFIASELNWKNQKVKIRQVTRYPAEPSSVLQVQCAEPVPFKLNIRHPYWAVSGIKITVNGEAQTLASRPGSYAVLERTWQNGDRIEVSMPMSLRTEAFRDNPNRLAIMYGPLVLCAGIEPNRPFPAIVGEKNGLLEAIKPVPDKALHFTGAGKMFRTAGETRTRNIELTPFYQMHPGPYVVYWDVFSQDQWRSKEEDYKQTMARQRELEGRTVDIINPGEAQNERDHQLKGEKTGSGDLGERKWRHATEGGWFSYKIKVQPDLPMELLCTYWGSDAGNRTFDLLIDGQKLATQTLQNNRPNKFYDEVYAIPAELTRGKSEVVLKFQARPDGFAGGLFGIRMIRAQVKSTAVLKVQADQPGIKVSPTLYGIFFEDINCSADGGIYAELVRNRSLENSDKPEFWSLVTRGAAKGSMSVSLESPLSEKNRRSLRLQIDEANGGQVGVVNDGYWGIALKKDAGYELSLYARGAEDFAGPLRVALENGKEEVLAEGKIDGITSKWKRFKLSLTASATDPKARLVITGAKAGTVWLDMVSLFPKETWKGHGLRPDLAGMLDQLKPAFVRFPGGCWVEGDTMPLAYRWKETIGDLSQRRTQRNIWQYWATHGLGYHEYLQMCEDLGAEPLFVINCGMSHRENIPMDQMGPWVQDALDAIEYANGPATSRWGAVRAKAGHPEPFHLKFMEIGNENGGPAYHERYALFHDAIKAKYPEINLIVNEWGGTPKSRPVQIVDEHYYNNPEFFMQQAGRYDKYDRKGPKVYVGEYAVTAGCGQGNLRGAVGEAAFMTGMERNSDVVVMSSYAPLFSHVDYKKWNPDLIYYDSARVCGTPSYYVQKMFSENRADVVVPCEITLADDQPLPPRHGGIGLGTWDTQAEYKDIQVTKEGQTLFSLTDESNLSGWKSAGEGAWKLENGVIRQTATGNDRRLTTGNPAWTDYTYSLKARKLGGNEGFLVIFQVKDNANWVWWNIGGWSNQRHGLEACEGGGKSPLGEAVGGKIETNRWYDIRIETRGQTIRCFLDGKLIHDVSFKAFRSLYAVAGKQEASGELILKVVNASATPQETEVQLHGIKNITAPVNATVLTSENPAAENSVEEPLKVVPVAKAIPAQGNRIKHVFPGNSVTVMRVKSE